MFHESQNNFVSSQARCLGREIEPWQKPPISFWKINVDAAIDSSGVVGLGIIIRNSTSDPIISRCKKVESCVDPDVAEWLACQEGLLLAKEVGGRKLIVETDCKLIHLSLKNDKDDLSYRGVVCESIKTEALHFELVVFSWARREANKVAHALAKLAISNPVFSCYSGVFPVSLLSAVPNPERFT